MGRFVCGTFCLCTQTSRGNHGKDDEFLNLGSLTLQTYPPVIRIRIYYYEDSDPGPYFSFFGFRSGVGGTQKKQVKFKNILAYNKGKI